MGLSTTREGSISYTLNVSLKCPAGYDVPTNIILSNDKVVSQIAFALGSISAVSQFTKCRDQLNPQITLQIPKYKSSANHQRYSRIFEVLHQANGIVAIRLTITYV